VTPTGGAVARGVAAVLTGAGLLAGCGGGPTRDTEPEGPLSVLTSPGSKFVRPRSSTPFYVTHGFLLCRDGGAEGTDLTLTRVEFHTTLEPVEVWPVVRSVPPASERDGSPDSWLPIGSAYGQPGAFDDPARGTFDRDIDGIRVGIGCEQEQDADAARMELDVVTEVAAAGSDITSFTVHYAIDGEPYELDVPWRMVTCGTRTTMRECAKG